MVSPQDVGSSANTRPNHDGPGTAPTAREVARALPGPRPGDLALVANLGNLDDLARLPVPAYPLSSVYVVDDEDSGVRHRQLSLPIDWSYELEELLKLLSWTTAPNTIAAYRPAIQHFWHFCAEHQLDRYDLASLRDFIYLVSFPRLVYLQAVAKGAPPDPPRAQPGVGRASVQSIIAAVSATFAARNLPLPSHSSAWCLWLRGLMRRLRQPKDKKDAILVEDLQRAVHLAREHKHKNPLIGLRDAALLLLGWNAALRRSEIAAVDVRHVRRDETERPLPQELADSGATASGWHLLIPASKTDQLGRGYEVPLYAAERLGPDMDVLVAWRRWIDAAKLTSGPAFRAFTAKGEMTDHSMSERAIASLCKSYAIGNISAHSLRAGWVTQAVIDGRDNYQIREVSRHTSDHMVLEYTRIRQRRRRGPGSLL